jgi:hypothetical protein
LLLENQILATFENNMHVREYPNGIILELPSELIYENVLAALIKLVILNRFSGDRIVESASFQDLISHLFIPHLSRLTST